MSTGGSSTKGPLIMPTINSLYYGGGQQPSPANVIEVSGTPNPAAIDNDLGTIAVDNAAGNAYILASKTGGTATWKEISGSPMPPVTLLLDQTSASTGPLTSGPNAGGISIVPSNPNQITTTANSGHHALSIGFNSATMGSASLTAGTATVANPHVHSHSLIFLTVNTPGGTPGFLSVPSASISDGVSFVVNSSNVADTSLFNYWIVS